MRRVLISCVIPDIVLAWSSNEKSLSSESWTPTLPLENIETLIERATVGDQKALYDLVRQTLLKFSCSHPLSYVTSFAVERVIAVV